uniref:Replication factor A C-terminal domain-containing protein n=1 Tax=Brassica oleracea var. oleracea TaxID=109376 RepID=A0A0D3E421_BRAOL
YLWDEAAVSFRLKFDASEATPTVLLVTTVNPKSLGGKLCLSSMSSSRVFLDEDVDPTREYLTWLTTNPSVTSLVNLVEVVKAETLTISEIAAFLKRQPAKVAYFDCIATIDDVKLGTEWYYIACKYCQTKLNCGPTTLLCPKCGNENATAVAKKATELIDAYVQENGGDAAELEVPLPQCFIDIIGQTKKFRIKVAHYNFTSTRLSLTATKIVSPVVLPPKNPPLNTPPTLLGAQNHRPGAEVEISDVAESSGGGTSATDDQKKAKRTKRSG